MREVTLGIDFITQLCISDKPLFDRISTCLWNEASFMGYKMVNNTVNMSITGIIYTHTSQEINITYTINDTNNRYRLIRMGNKDVLYQKVYDKIVPFIREEKLNSILG